MVGDLMAVPLDELALHVRDGTTIGATPESAQQYLSFGLHHGSWKKPTGKLAFSCPPNHSWSGLTDWRVAKLGDVDFSPARLDGTRAVVTCSIQTHMALAGSHRNRWAYIGEAGVALGLWAWSDAECRLPSGLGKYPTFQRPAKKPSSIDECRVQEPL